MSTFLIKTRSMLLERFTELVPPILVESSSQMFISEFIDHNKLCYKFVKNILHPEVF